jgi:hypothetical protein
MAFEMVALPVEADDVFPKAEMRFASGDDCRFSIYLEDPNPAYDEDLPPGPSNLEFIPRDLTGWSAKGQIRKSNKLVDDKGVAIPVLATMTFSGFGTDGYIQVHLPHAESAKVRIRSMWDIQTIDPDLEIDTIAGGPCVPTGDVTRDE